jgi:cytochrome c peroxidase
VIIDGVAFPAESFGPEPGSSRDQVTIKVPKTGEADVYLKADGKLSNVARLTLVGQVPDLPSAKIQLGRYLFYDKRMSVNNSASCATCHRQDLAFTDGRAQAIGATEQLHPRSAMSLVNLAYSKTFNWNDPTVRSLEQQALKPMRSKPPVELGLNEESFLKLISTDEIYRPIFRQAFPQDPNPYTIANITRAIAAFERTITSTSSPYDRFHRDGDETAISESAKRGEILFFLDGGPSCFRCHSGTNLSDSAYHNNGLGAPGKFKTPTLRNIAITAPYMHDGSIATLEQVVDHYATGGKTGHDPIMRKFQLTPQNRTDLVAFLKTLTDENLLQDQRYSNPWPK